MTDLQECRRKIDEIDNQMVELFEKRMKVCEEVAEYKIHTGKKVAGSGERACQTGRDQEKRRTVSSTNLEPTELFSSRSWPSAESVSISFSPNMVRKKRKTSKWWSSFPEIM